MLTWDTRHITLMKRWSSIYNATWDTTWFHQSNMTGVPSKTASTNLLGPVILLWWNHPEVIYRCCFTWDIRHITLMKSGVPSKTASTNLLDPLISLRVIWRASQVRCCFTWDTLHITLMKSGGPGGLPGTLVILLWWNQVVQEVYRCCFTLGHPIYLSNMRWSQVKQHAVYLGHPSYYSDEIRCPGGLQHAVLWDHRHITLSNMTGSQVKQHLLTSWTTWCHQSNMTGVPNQTASTNLLDHLISSE